MLLNLPQKMKLPALLSSRLSIPVRFSMLGIFLALCLWAFISLVHSSKLLQQNKEQAAQDLVTEYYTSPYLGEVKRRLWFGSESGKNYPKLAENWPAAERDIMDVLNFLDSVCIMVERGAVDRTAISNALGPVMSKSVSLYIRGEHGPNGSYAPVGKTLSASNFQSLVRFSKQFDQETELKNEPNPGFFGWIGDNRDWLFDGLGVVLIGALITWVFKSKDIGGLRGQRSP